MEYVIVNLPELKESVNAKWHTQPAIPPWEKIIEQKSPKIRVQKKHKPLPELPIQRNARSKHHDIFYSYAKKKRQTCT